ncbi:cation/H(+) antiporter, partial [Enterococcus hirae]
LALVDNSGAIQLLAEVGVLLLLFLSGLELNLQEFRAVLGPALATVGLQIVGSAGLMFALGWLFDWPLLQIVVLSFAITL